MNGYFELEIGNKITRTSNMIVTSGRKLILELLTGEEDNLDIIAIGSSSDAVNASQESLISEFASKKISNFVTGATSIALETSFGYNEGNGTIREIGILSKNGVLFARSLTVEQVKTNSSPMKARYVINMDGF